MPKIHQISTSKGGVPKRPVDYAVIHELGVVGDRQPDTIHHGGPDRALCLFSLEMIQALQAEGHPIEPGFAGENLTISGLDWNAVIPGTQMRIEVHYGGTTTTILNMVETIRSRLDMLLYPEDPRREPSAFTLALTHDMVPTPSRDCPTRENCSPSSERYQAS